MLAARLDRPFVPGPVEEQLLEAWPGLPRQPATLLLRDAFDMLEEDYAEERFYAAVRRAFWAAPEGSPERRAAQTLITALEF